MRDPKTEKELTNPAGTPAWVQWGYRGLFNLGLGLSAPYYARRMARRGGWKDRLGQRFGRYDNSFIQRCHGQTNLWFHAVGMGGILLLSVPLVKRLENKLPSVQWILSATTTTGMAQWHQQMQVHRPHAFTRSIVAHGFGNPWKSFAPKPSFSLRPRYGPTFSGRHSTAAFQCF